MPNTRSIWTSLAWRAPLGLSLILLGTVFLAGTSSLADGVARGAFSLALCMAGGLLLGPPLCRLLAAPTGRLFYPSDKFDRPQPMYSIPAGQRASGLTDEAFSGFQAIAEEHPQLLRPYREMMDIAINDMKNPELAEATLQRGVATLKRKKDREALRDMYETMRTRAADVVPRERRTIAFKRNRSRG